jgi:hypothetical protein
MSDKNKGTSDKPRWQKEPYTVYLREKRTGKDTVSCVQAKSVEEAKFIAHENWGVHFHITDVKLA